MEFDTSLLHVSVDDVNISRSDIEKNYKAFNFTSTQHINTYEKLLVEGFNVISKALADMDQIFVDTKFEFGYLLCLINGI